MNNKEFKGILIPYKSISRFNEMILLITFVPYIYNKDNWRSNAMDLIKKGDKFNNLSLLMALIFIIFCILGAEAERSKI